MSYTNRDIDSFEAIRMLKIGYTGEEFYKERMKSYRFYTEIKEIAKIPGGTREDEKRAHLFFGKYRVRGNEFYSYEQEIIDFFSENDTIEKMRENLPAIVSDKERAYLSRIFWPVLTLFEKYEVNVFRTTSCKLQLQNNIIDSGVNTVDGLFDYLFKLYGVDKVGQLKEQYLLQRKEIEKELDVFDSLHNFDDKLKYICGLKGQVSEDSYQLLLNSIPEDYGTYILSLGVDRCANFCYRNSLLREELDKIINNQDKVDIVKEVTLTRFEVGKRYSREVIKQMLGDIYAYLGYKKTPKASDLSEWFEVKTCQVTNPKTKKRDHGFLILGLKSS